VSRALQATLISLPFLTYLLQVFSSAPYLQHEILGQAFWWTRSGENFWALLFDSERMDCFPGRFRYVEYLLEAGLWKASALGIIPRDLYDYLAICLTLLCGACLLRACKRHGLSLLSTMALLSFFLLSTQAYMVSVFHFRKAKILVALFFFVLYELSESWKKRERKGLVVFLGFLGVLTDPFWILFAPFFSLALDLKEKRKGIPMTGWLMTGWALGGLSVILLNGFVGPRFSPNAQLYLIHPPGVPVNFFRLENIFSFYKIALDVLGLIANRWAILWAISLFFILFSLSRTPLMIFWGLSLLLGAYLIEPSTERAFFSGYYGYVFLVFFVVALLDVFRNAGPRARTALQLAIIFFMICHQTKKSDVFAGWKSFHTESSQVARKLEADRKEISSILKHLKKSKEPYYFVLDKRENPVMRLSGALYTDDKGNWERTDLSYLYVPAVFRREVESGKIVLLEKKRAQ
jgi:hypothetical protein